MLFVDQTEDHIDNTFIADTLIKAIRREASPQLLDTTMQYPGARGRPLGVQLASDGKRGFLVQAAPLHDAEVIEAISSVMEGGAEAFRRRAKSTWAAPLT